MPVPFHPFPPVAPRFDAAANTWTLTRHADVAAALCEPCLVQGSEESSAEIEARSSALRNAVQTDLARITSEAWAAQAASRLLQLLEDVPAGQPTDLVQDIIHPWTVRLVIDLNEGREEPELERIARQLLFGGKCGDKSCSGSDAEQELDRMLEDGRLSICKSMVFGLTQTLVSFLAKAWVALLENPAQAELLRRNPQLTGNAIEELLRFAGPVHTLYRRAGKDVSLGDFPLKQGQSLVLGIDSANYDPVRFPEPERLDLTRATAGHLGLGRGAHACVGSVLVRIASRIATPLFLSARPSPIGSDAVVWTDNRTLLWPSAVPVHLAGFRSQSHIPE
jgi:cytochrome P450